MTNYILANAKHVLNVKVGDFLSEIIYPDRITTLHNSRKVTKIHKNGTLRVECIDSNCKKIGCTYLRLTESELKHLKIDNTLTKSQRLTAVTII